LYEPEKQHLALPSHAVLQKSLLHLPVDALYE